MLVDDVEVDDVEIVGDLEECLHEDILLLLIQGGLNEGHQEGLSRVTVAGQGRTMVRC